MTAHVVDEFLVFDKYRVMVLDREINNKPNTQYRIDGKLFDPISIHAHTSNDTIPRNYIAVRATDSFKGSAVEFI